MHLHIGIGADAGGANKLFYSSVYPHIHSDTQKDYKLLCPCVRVCPCQVLTCDQCLDKDTENIEFVKRFKKIEQDFGSWILSSYIFIDREMKIC